MNNEWRQKELVFLLLYAVIFYIIIIHYSLQLSHDHYNKLYGLRPGLISSQLNMAGAKRRRVDTWDNLPEHRNELLLRRDVTNLQEKREKLEEIKVIPERGLDFSNLYKLGSEIPNWIRDLRWESVVKTPESYNIELVKEFYACILPEAFQETRDVWIQGRVHRMSANVINHCLGLRLPFQVWRQGLPSLVDQPEIHEEYNGDIAASLRVNSSPVWDEGIHKIFKVEMNADQALMYTWIRHNLMPSRLSSEVDQDCAKLLYCIKLGVPINLGEIIFSRIVQAAWKVEISPEPLPYPSLISYALRLDHCSFNGRLTPPPKDLGNRAWLRENMLCQTYLMTTNNFREDDEEEEDSEETEIVDMYDYGRTGSYGGHMKRGAGTSTWSPAFIPSPPNFPEGTPNWVIPFYNKLYGNNKCMMQEYFDQLVAMQEESSQDRAEEMKDHRLDVEDHLGSISTSLGELSLQEARRIKEQKEHQQNMEAFYG